MTGGMDRWIRWTTTGCVGMLALIAGTVSYLHMHLLVELQGQPGWVAALTPLSVDGMIVAASTTLLADSRAGERGGVLPWALLVVGSVASLAANVAVAQPTVAGRVIAAWPSFALIAAYELLMRQVAAAQLAAVGQRTLSRHRDYRAGRVTSARCRIRGILPQIQPVGTVGLVVWRGGIFSGRRGCGRWPIGQVMARFPSDVRLAAATAVMSDGVGLSGGQELQANSPPSLACGWSSSSPLRPRSPTAVCTESEHLSDHQRSGPAPSADSGRCTGRCFASGRPTAPQRRNRLNWLGLRRPVGPEAGLG